MPNTFENLPEKLEAPESKRGEVLDLLALIQEIFTSQIRELVKTPADLADFEKWRQMDEKGREARQLRKISEILTAAKLLLERYPDRKEEISSRLLETLNLQDIASRPRTEQFLAYLTAEILHLEKPKVKEEVENLIAGLKRAKSTEGELNALELLSSPRIGFGLKREWLEAQFLPRLLFLLRRDLEEAAKIPPPAPEKPPEIAEGEILPRPELPSPDRDFLRPSIEETDKREGEPIGYFTVVPFYGGYWKEKTFEEWDGQNLCFRASSRKLAEVKIEKEEVDEKTQRVMAGIVRGRVRTSLPLPYNFAFNPETLRFPEGTKIKILKDEDGNYLLEAGGEGTIPFTVSLAKRKERVKPPAIPPQPLSIETGRLSEETERLIFQLEQERISPLEKARRLKQYVKKILKYPAVGDSSFNAVYYQEPTKFFQKVEQFKKADCDVANAFFIALLSRLKISARMAAGHYIKVKDHQGRAVFSSSTKHAWTEVWDNGWHILDATPAGAPEMDEEETDERQKDENFEGDFGEIEAEVISEEELKKIIEEIKKNQEEKMGEESPEEIRALNFSQEADCSPEEAKQILEELKRARELKDSGGRKILDLLSQEFMKIIKENLKEVPSYRAPVRLPEADELEEPVEAFLDIKLGEREPSGFKKIERKSKKIQEYGGFDLILVCDKSGSMREVDPQSGEPKWKEQQRFVYLIAEALHRFSRYCKIYKIELINQIDVRMALITFQGGGYEVVLHLSENWGPREQYILWKKLQENIGHGTPDHLGIKASQRIILEDIEKAEGKRKKELKKRLRLVIVTADGGSDNSNAVQSALKDLRGNGVIVEGVGLTSAARKIEATYYPYGKCLESVRDAPEWVAQRIIEQVKKLYPQKIKS